MMRLLNMAGGFVAGIIMGLTAFVGWLAWKARDNQ